MPTPVQGAADVIAVDGEKPAAMDKSKLFSEMEGKFAKDTETALKPKPSPIRSHQQNILLSYLVTDAQD